MLIRIFILFLAFFSCAADSKILIFTYAFNKPYFIELQDKTFRKFLEDEYEFVVFNDANTVEMELQINEMCKRLKLKCIKIPQEIHDYPYLKRFYEKNHEPHVRNSNVVQYSLDTVGFKHDDILALFDSDLFLVKKFSIRKFMEGYDVAGLETFRNFPYPQYESGYLWIGFVFMNMSTMPNKTTINFNCGIVENHKVDAGGHTYLYLKENPSVRVKWFDYVAIHGGSETPKFPTRVVICKDCARSNNVTCKHNSELLKSMGFDEYAIRFIQDGPVDIEFLQGNAFFHYKHGTNWHNESTGFHDRKTEAVKKFMNSILT